MERFKAYVSVNLILLKDGKVLLLRRFRTGYRDGFFSLIAGHLNGGETTRECIIREAKEEVGIELNQDDMQVVHIVHRYSLDREYIDFYIKSEKWNGEIKNLEPNECEDIEWYEIDSLPDQIYPEIKLVFESVKRGKFFSELGWESREDSTSAVGSSL